ncbi:SRPBCC family protein [Myroides odoratimimus subsp. xuanwuensis]
MRCTPDNVWSVLVDGWIYGQWVVGACRIRDVDHEWPAKGSRIHHSVGLWPLLLDDYTEVLEVHPGRRLDLRARAWPAGVAIVSLRIEEHPDGCQVTMEERATEGLGAVTPGPLQDVMLHPRNREALQRLAYLAEGREAGNKPS